MPAALHHGWVFVVVRPDNVVEQYFALWLFGFLTVVLSGGKVVFFFFPFMFAPFHYLIHSICSLSSFSSSLLLAADLLLICFRRPSFCYKCVPSAH